MSRRGLVLGRGFSDRWVGICRRGEDGEALSVNAILHAAAKVARHGRAEPPDINRR